MRGFARFQLMAWFVVLLTSCGGGSGPVECVDNVCPCSEAGVRAAIDEGLGPYTFDCDGPTTVVTGREIIIDRDVTLDGQGVLTLDADGRHRVLSILEGVTVELIGLAAINGRETEEHGAGIRNEGALTVRRCRVAGSSAGRDSGCRTDDRDQLCSEGGGIWNAGTLMLINSTVFGNAAHFGGGIANRGGSTTLVESEIRANLAEGCRVGAVVCSGGGGLWNSGTLTMLRSIVSESTADWGSGVYNQGAPTITESRIIRNSAGFDGGGLLNFETMTLIDSIVADNLAGQSGGGIANQGGTLILMSSTLSSNDAAASGGGIISQTGGAAELVNATVSGNTAETGGAIYADGGLVVSSSTIAENDAPTARAIFVAENPTEAPRTMSSTLVEGDCAGPLLDSEGYNVESPGDTCGLDQGTDRPREPGLALGPLVNNGGPTPTHALLEGSIAIDRIPEDDCLDAAGAPLTVDQRGEPRPAGPSSTCDVGAFEAQP